MPCAQPKPFPPAAALLCAFTLCIGLGLLVAGLRQPDHPLPPIRTASDQTPIALATKQPTSTPMPSLAFAPVSTPRSTFFVRVQTYALLSLCGTYTVEVPNQPGMAASSSVQPVPNCRVRVAQ
jgi:hypothetical protein